MMLYLLVPGTLVTGRDALVLAMVLYSAFVFVFHYANFFRADARWKLAVESWVMIAFVTAVAWHTGRTDSVLLNLYLLVIIASALTLDRITTLLEVALIAACHVYLGGHGGLDVFSIGYAGELMVELAPFLLVAYLTTMLASDVHRANARVHVLAESDELTGLMNMRGFMLTLRREHGLAERHARIYTLAMIDVDNLKQLNDRHGHETGNRALKLVAAVLREHIRSTDAAGRFGGDEFVLLLSESNRQQAGEVMGRIREKLREAELMNGRDRLALDVSIGLAAYPASGTGVEELLSAADAAMYADKQHKHERKPPEAMPA